MERQLSAHRPTAMRPPDSNVKSISEGTFTTEQNGSPTEAYYKVRIALKPVTLHNVPPNFRLVPGITLSGDIHVGSHSLFMYLASGIMRGVGEILSTPLTLPAWRTSARLGSTDR